MVEFIKADLTCMPQIKNESVDLIVCHATIRAVNNRPLKAVKALSEFYRVLKKGGWLIIDDEYPLPKPSKIEEEVQVKRWQTYKSVAELVDGEHYTEICPEEIGVCRQDCWIQRHRVTEVRGRMALRGRYERVERRDARDDQ